MSLINQEGYCEYLEDTLIPDLIESGMMQTAKDLFIAKHFLVTGDEETEEEAIIEMMCERYGIEKEDFA